MKTVPHADRPLVDDTLFWDWNLNTLDFRTAYVSVIKRILERGTIKEWDEMIRFYSKAKVEDTIRNEIKDLPNYILPQILRYFSLKETDIECFRNKPSRTNYWI